MAKRSKLSARASKKLFRKGAKNVKRSNYQTKVMRGGIRK